MASFLRAAATSLFSTATSLSNAASTRFLIPRAAATPLHQVRSYCQIMKETRNMRDHKRRVLASKFELKRNLYKAMFRDPNLPTELREKVLWKLSKLPRSSSFTRVRNRCIFSGRPRAVYQKFRMSRIVFRKLASEGQLMGVKKASW